MALSTFVGSFTAPATSGAKAVTGVGFQPKVVLFWGDGLTADGTSGSGSLEPFYVGVGISSSSGAVLHNDDNNSAGGTAVSAALCIDQENGSLGAEISATMTSLDADGFTLNFTVANSNPIVVNFLALGGTDLTNVALKTGITAPTATGSVGYTGIGFQPTAILLFGADTGQGVGGGIGWGTSSSARACHAWGYDGSPGKYQRTSSIFALVGSASKRWEADLVSLDADGFTLNWTTAVNSTSAIFALCLKGGQYKVGSLNQKATTGSQGYTGVGFQPKALWVGSKAAVSGSGIDAALNAMVGAAVDATHRAALNYNGNKGYSQLSRAAVINVADDSSATAPVTTALADLTSLDADGFTLNWTTTDGTQREVVYLAIGDAAVGGGGGGLVIPNVAISGARPFPYAPPGARRR